MAPRKKKRTPAQIRATKKLVALNRKRRARKKVAKKKVVKRKVAKRRVVRRKVAKKRAVKRKVRRKSNPSGNYVYFVMAKNKRTGKEGFYTGFTFDTSIKKALLSKTKLVMDKLAKDVKVNKSNWDLYVVKENASKIK